MNGYRNYRRSEPATGWTRIDLLLALYDGAIDRLAKAADAIRSGNALAASENQEVQAENLANASMPGFRQRGVAAESFDRVLNRSLAPTGAPVGAHTSGAYHDFRPGALQQTGVPYDLALSEPDQFFAVAGPNGTLYTRNGSFRLTTQGNLVTQAGERECRTVTAEEVLAAARNEVRRSLPAARIELVQPVVVKLPEVPVGETVAITAKPHSRPVVLGRVQMDVTIMSGSQILISLPVYLEATGEPSPAAAAKGPSTWPDAPAPFPVPNRSEPPRYVLPASAAAPIQPLAPGEAIVRLRQPIAMTVKTGAIFLSVPGEAMQDGKLGQTITVRNTDTKKTISARVTGPGTVEVDLGGNP